MAGTFAGVVHEGNRGTVVALRFQNGANGVGYRVGDCIRRVERDGVPAVLKDDLLAASREARVVLMLRPDLFAGRVTCFDRNFPAMT